MITFDSREIRKFEKDLRTLNKRAIPFAIKSAINGTAFKHREIWQGNIRADLVTRNKFTVGSIRVKQATTTNIARMQSETGSIAPYMFNTEFGGTEVASGKVGTPIATSYSARQGMKRQPRTRLSTGANKRKNIELKKPKSLAKSRKARVAAAINQAAASGSRYVFLDLGRRKGIFKVVGSKKRPKIKMLWDLTRKSVFIPAHPTLRPATDAVRAFTPGLYLEALKFQRNRLGLFRGF